MKAILFFSLILHVVAEFHVGAIQCYQCNLECRNGTAANEGCDLNDSPAVTVEDDNGTLSQKVSCAAPSEVSNCKACMTIKTTFRRYIGRGEFGAVEIMSRVCQMENSPYSEDVCYHHGPSWAESISCYCYSDLCNSAHRSLPFTFSLIPLIFHFCL